MQGPRVRAVDSQGRKIKGVYIRDGIYIAGFQANGKWMMKNLPATTLAEARYQREQIVRKLREEKRQEKTQHQKSVDRLYSDARKLAQQLSLQRGSVARDVRPMVARAEGLMMETTDLLFDAWRKT